MEDGNKGGKKLEQTGDAVEIKRRYKRENAAEGKMGERMEGKRKTKEGDNERSRGRAIGRRKGQQEEPKGATEEARETMEDAGKERPKMEKKTKG